MKDELSFLKINLECAANGMYFGSHKPMDEFSRQLLNTTWLDKLNFAGYSSSRVDFEIQNEFIRYISVYKSFQAILERYEQRVTICLRLNNNDISYTRENLRIEDAIKLIKKIVNKSDEIIKFNNITISEGYEELFIDIKDGWFSYNEINRTIKKIVEISNERIQYCNFVIENLEQLSLDYLFEILSLNEKIKNELMNIRVFCDEELISKYFEYYKSEEFNMKFEIFNKFRNEVDIRRIKEKTILILPLAGHLDSNEGRTYLKMWVFSSLKPNIKEVIVSFKNLKTTRSESTWVKLIELTDILKEREVKLIISDLDKVQLKVINDLGMESKLIIDSMEMRIGKENERNNHITRDLE